MTEAAERQQQAVDEFLDLLRLERDGDRWIGRTPDWGAPTVFGGVGLAMTIGAACRDAPEGKRLHSLHAHFLRPVHSGCGITFHGEVVKAGQSCRLRSWRTTRSSHGTSDGRSERRPTRRHHAAWFHRPARADEWHLQDVQALVNAGGRGTLRGVIRDTAGRIVVSMAQEMLLQPVR